MIELDIVNHDSCDRAAGPEEFHSLSNPFVGAARAGETPAQHCGSCQGSKRAITHFETAGSKA